MSYTEKIQEVIDGSDVALFMKGTPDSIMCGNSERALQALRRAGAPITAVDVLPDMQIRAGSLGDLRLADDPAGLRQGRAVGGADIVEEMERTGELEQTLREKLGEGYGDVARREDRRAGLGPPRLRSACEHVVGVRRRLHVRACTFSTFPSAPITNVERTIPMYVARERLLAPDAVGLGDRVVGVGEQRERQPVLRP